MAFEGDRTITFKEGSRFYVFHLWSDVQGEKAHDVSDTPNNTGQATSEVHNRSPNVARGQITIASGVQIPALLNVPRGKSQENTSMLEQRDILYELEGKQVTAYARSLPGGFMTGILRMVRVTDDAQYDNVQKVSFELKEDLGAGEGFDPLSLLEADSITIPKPPSVPIDDPEADPPPPGTGKKRCVRTRNFGVRAREAIGDVWREVKKDTKKVWKKTTNWLKKNLVNPVVDFGKKVKDKVVDAYRDVSEFVDDKLITPIEHAYDVTLDNVKGFLFGQCKG